MSAHQGLEGSRILPLQEAVQQLGIAQTTPIPPQQGSAELLDGSMLLTGRHVILSTRAFYFLVP
jgi:hypothetical protein